MSFFTRELAARWTEGPRVGIVSPYAPRKGLATLTRNIEWALDGAVEVFPIRRLKRLDQEFVSLRAEPAHPSLRHPGCVPRGTSLTDWLAGIDLLISVERPVPSLCAYARERGVRTAVVALPDWIPSEPEIRVEQLAAADACVIYGRTPAEALQADGLENIRCFPLALRDPIEPPRPTGDTITFYFNIGVGGPVDRRHVPLVLDTFRQVLPAHPHARLLVKVHPSAHKRVGKIASFHPQMRVVDRELPRDEMDALQREVDVTLFPTRFEGVGYPILESLHGGVPVITTDAAPMNEMVRHEENGLLVSGTLSGAFGALMRWELDPDHLRQSVERCLAEPGLVDRLKSGTGKGRSEAAQQFRDAWRQLVTEFGPRRLNLGAGDDTHAARWNLDIRRCAGTDVVADAHRLPFADASLDEVLAQDLLEHFPGAETDALLDEWIRVLRPGGTLRVQTPDIRALAKSLLRGRLSSERTIEWLYGGQDHPYNFHQTGFDEARLKALLAERGIEDLQRVRKRVSSKNVCFEGRRARGA
ncbi:MAG: glycosyltransferase [Myxococcota bacterium]